MEGRICVFEEEKRSRNIHRIGVRRCTAVKFRKEGRPTAQTKATNSIVGDM